MSTESTRRAGAIIRYRMAITLIGLAVLGLGMLSRSSLLPAGSFLAAYSGDTLWALLIYLLARWLTPQLTPLRSALHAALFAFAIELSQLYQGGWLNSVRQTRLGGLILGFGFLWSDLLCYAVGIGLGLGSELLYQRLRGKRDEVEQDS